MLETTSPRSDFQDLAQATSVLEIVGDMIRVRTDKAALGDLAIVENVDGTASTARVVGVDRDIASLQVFTGGKGLSTRAKVRFTGLPLQVTHSENILGRIFSGRRAHRRPPDAGSRPAHQCGRPHREPDHAGAGLEYDRDRSAHDRPVQLPG